MLKIGDRIKLVNPTANYLLMYKNGTGTIIETRLEDYRFKIAMDGDYPIGYTGHKFWQPSSSFVFVTSQVKTLWD